MQNILKIVLPIILIIHIIFLYFKRVKKRRDILEEKITRREFNKTNTNILKRVTSNNKNYKILIVEDDPINRKILISQLTSAKYNVISVENGTDALKEINNNNSIDLVLLDIMLPDITGFTVCKKIREKFTVFEMPVIMVTAKTRIEDLLEGFEAGANDFIIKPYNIYEMIARINSSLSLKSVVEHNSSLEKINRLKSDIIDMAAHDLKSPLTIISGYARRLQNSLSSDSKEHNNAVKILESSDKMLSIVSTLLEDTNQDEDIKLDKIPVNIVPVVEKSIKFYEDSARNKKQIIELETASSSVINIDINSFTTIIDNLLSNAIKYSPLNSVIKIVIQDNSNKSTISISDEGQGFSEDEIKNLFNKYYPMTNRPTHGESSTGIGLSIVKNMVNKNRGFIDVESEKGRGSKFILTFPKS